MNLTKIYLTAKSIHRLLVITTAILALTMAFTGASLKYGFVITIFNLDPGRMRFLHNSLSPYLGTTLTLMAITGLIMYLYPYLHRQPKRSAA